MKDTIVGIGELLWDMLPQGKQLGGAPANFAYHVCRLGGNGWAVSAIGRDPLGEELTRQLSGKKLGKLIAEVSAPTGTVGVTLDERGVPSYDITKNVAWDEIPYTDRLDDLAAQTKAVCFGTLAQRSARSRETISRFISRLSPDALKVFDINLRQDYYSKELIDDSLQVSDILKINDEELETVSALFGLCGNAVERCRAIIRRWNLQLVILTKGGEGSDVVTLSGVHSIVPEPIVIADTVGAGDSFTAAFVTAYLGGASIEEAHCLAGKVSSWVCTRPGAMPEE